MTEKSETQETWDILKLFGFEPDSRVVSDIQPGLSLDFGNLVLSASAVMNLRLHKVILFTGILKGPRSLAEVQFEMPRQVASPEEAAAWVTWNLDRHAGGEFNPIRHVPWLELGRSNQTLLPSVEDQAAYGARPCCLVDRDWARMALNTLSRCIQGGGDGASVEFSFDGEVLKIRCGGEVIAVTGKGAPWDCRYSLQAGQLRELPKRLMRRQVEFSVWKGKFWISGWSFEGVKEESDGGAVGR